MTDRIDRISDLGTILGVWAHPDDEAFLSAGTMAAAVASGSRVAVVTATRGELGTADPTGWPPDRMGRLRERELAASLAALGVTEHHWLGYVDGSLATAAPEEGIGRIRSVVDGLGPDTILTFGPDGMTGHPDHRTISRWVSEAVTGKPIRVLHATTSDDFLERHADIHERFDLFFAGPPPKTDRSELAFELRLDPHLLDIKLVALRAQASQISPMVEALGVERMREWWAVEWFAAGAAGAIEAAA